MNILSQLASGALTDELVNASTSYPVLSPGTYAVTIAKVEVTPTKDGSGEMLTIGLQLAQDAEDVDGNVLHAGFGLTHRIYCTVTEKVTQEMVLRNIAQFQDCFSIPRDSWDETFESWLGLEGTVKTKVEPERTGPDGTQYAASTGIASFISAE